MTAPDLSTVTGYLDDTSGWDTDAVTSALAGEKAAQARVCRVPADDADWPADLVEALCRRVAHNLALRALPLGVSAAIADAAVATTRVGGTDAEVARLEAPWRKRIVG